MHLGRGEGNKQSIKTKFTEPESRNKKACQKDAKKKEAGILWRNRMCRFSFLDAR